MDALTLQYDPQARAVYIYIGDTEWRSADGRLHTFGIGSGDRVMADLTPDGRCWGIEILDVAEPVVHVYEKEPKES